MAADGRRRWKRHCAAGAMLGALAVGGCSYVPDEANPVEWYKGARNWVDPRKTEAQLQAQESAESLPMPNAGAPFPNLATVPERPAGFDQPPSNDIERSLREDRREAIEADETVRSRMANFAIVPSTGPTTGDVIRRTLEGGVTRAPDRPVPPPRLPRRERPPPPPDIPDLPEVQPGQSFLPGGNAPSDRADAARWIPAQDCTCSDGPHDA